MRITLIIWIGLGVSFMRDGVMRRCIVLHWVCSKIRARSIGSETSATNTSPSSTVRTRTNAKVALPVDSQTEKTGYTKKTAEQTGSNTPAWDELEAKSRRYEVENTYEEGRHCKYRKRMHRMDIKLCIYCIIGLSWAFLSFCLVANGMYIGWRLKDQGRIASSTSRERRW